jgi:hypothetical protein
LIRFLDGMRPVPDVVSNLVGKVILGPEPSAGLESHDFQSGARQWKHGKPSRRAQANHDYIGLG